MLKLKVNLPEGDSKVYTIESMKNRPGVYKTIGMPHHRIVVLPGSKTKLYISANPTIIEPVNDAGWTSFEFVDTQEELQINFI